MPPSAARPDRTLIAIVSVIAVIVVIAIAVVFTRGGPPDADPGTPEGVVQSYARAVLSGDRPAAMDLLVSDISDNCDHAEPSTLEDLRMTIVSTSVHGDTAVVQVTIAHGTGGGLFGDSGYTSKESFTLEREAGAWKVEYTPWEFILCFNEGNR